MVTCDDDTDNNRWANDHLYIFWCGKRTFATTKTTMRRNISRTQVRNICQWRDDKSSCRTVIIILLCCACRRLGNRKITSHYTAPPVTQVVCGPRSTLYNIILYIPSTRWDYRDIPRRYLYSLFLLLSLGLLAPIGPSSLTHV